MSENPRPQGLKGRNVGRRNILKLGATSAVLPAMIGPSVYSDKRQDSRTASGPDSLTASGPVSIGYWSGDPDALLAHARDLASGDAGLASTGAELQMVGMGQADNTSAALLQSLAVDLQVGQENFRAWRYDNTGVANISSPASYAVPVDKKLGLTFSVAATHNRLTNVVRKGGFRLSPGKEAGALKLRSGYYVLALGANGNKPRIHWAGYEIAGDSTGQSFYLRKNGKAVTSFPYLIFTIGPKRPSKTNYI